MLKIIAKLAAQIPEASRNMNHKKKNNGSKFTISILLIVIIGIVVGNTIFKPPMDSKSKNQMLESHSKQKLKKEADQMLESHSKQKLKKEADQMLESHSKQKLQKEADQMLESHSKQKLTEKQMEEVLDYIFMSVNGKQTLPQSTKYMHLACSLNSSFSMILATLFKYKEIFLEKVNSVMFCNREVDKREKFVIKWFYNFFCTINYKSVDDVSLHLLELLYEYDILKKGHSDNINLRDYSEKMDEIFGVIDIFLPSNIRGVAYEYTDNKTSYTKENLPEVMVNQLKMLYEFDGLSYINNITLDDITLKKNILDTLKNFHFVKEDDMEKIAQHIILHKKEYIQQIECKNIEKENWSDINFCIFFLYILNKKPTTHENIAIQDICYALKGEFTNLGQHSISSKIIDDLSLGIEKNLLSTHVAEQAIGSGIEVLDILLFQSGSVSHQIIEHMHDYNCHVASFDLIANIKIMIHQITGYIYHESHTKIFYKKDNQLIDEMYGFPIDSFLINQTGHFYSVFQYKNNIYEMNFGASHPLDNMDIIWNCYRNFEAGLASKAQVSKLIDKKSDYQLYYRNDDALIALNKQSNTESCYQNIIMKHNDSKNHHTIYRYICDIGKIKN